MEVKSTIVTEEAILASAFVAVGEMNNSLIQLSSFSDGLSEICNGTAQPPYAGEASVAMGRRIADDHLRGIRAERGNEV